MPQLSRFAARAGGPAALQEGDGVVAPMVQGDGIAFPDATVAAASAARGGLRRRLAKCVAGRLQALLKARNAVAHGLALALHGGGAQQRYGLRADLTCLGKIVGGGMPLAVYGGRADVMSRVAPLGPVYQAGTLSGNPVATACGLATLKEITRPGFYEALGADRKSVV